MPVLARTIACFERLESIERLSGGASQETYKLIVQTKCGTRVLALRREAGGVPMVRTALQVGLQTEARLLKCAPLAPAAR